MPDRLLPVRSALPLKRLVAVGVLVSFGFIALCWSVLAEIGRRDADMARANAANLVTSVGSEIARNIEMYDLSLQAAADGIRSSGIDSIPAHLRQMVLFDRAASAPGLGTIMILDRDGEVVAESRPAAAGRESYADRDYFQVHKYNRHSGRYITAPWATRRGEVVIGISRRLNDANGDFAGVVIGTMKVDYLRELFGKIKRQPGDALTLVRENGVVIMRSPFDADVVGKSVAASGIFQRMSLREQGSFEGVAGLDGAPRLYAFERLKDLPFILSYGTSLETLYADWWRQAWRIGAIVLLLCATNMALVVFLARSLRRRDEAERTLKRIAVTDSLTGLGNRGHFDRTVELEWNRARRREQPLALLMIDADYFKDFNDANGHQAGDTALAAIADCIASSTKRASEFAARYGGEEFAVVLPGETAEEAMQVAEAIRGKVNALRGLQAGQADCTPSVSIGVAALVPQAGLSTRDLIRAADAALYSAKRGGRDRCVAAPSQLKILAGKMAA